MKWKGIRTDATGEPLPRTATLASDPGSSSTNFHVTAAGWAATPLDDWVFAPDHAIPLLENHFGVLSLEGFGLSGKPAAAAAAGAILYYVRSTKEVPVGKSVKLRFEFEKTGQEKFGAGGIGRLYINDEKVGEGQIPRTVKFMYANYEGFDIGIDTGTPVTDEYKPGARFTGKIEKVMIDLFGERHIDPEAETKAVLKSQ